MTAGAKTVRRRRTATARRRCAVYTRKSTEAGLEQSFNSLDAQREACEAYIASQRHEGWRLLKARYDDGGVSGATLARPGLQALLAAIEVGQVDIVVVYKVDRLTRALGDFAKLVEVFDAHQVSFVSVTQHFNTTDSMGRLTLNMLLSFAQFEREVTGERIRDKIAASKRKGLWMGGLPPYGYDVKDKQLVVNATEAATVTRMFRRYLDLGSVHALQDELAAAGIRSKRGRTQKGRAYGGRPWSRGSLYRLLRNPVYRGRIAHRGEEHPGQHAAIIEEALWERVQQKLAANRHARHLGENAKSPSLLAGILVGAHDQPFTPTHTSKQGRRYRYYVSRQSSAAPTSARHPVVRLPAQPLEQAVIAGLSELLVDRAALAEVLTHAKPSADALQRAFDSARALAEKLPDLPTAQAREQLLAIDARVTLDQDQVHLSLCTQRLGQLLGAVPTTEAPGAGAESETRYRLPIPARVARQGRGYRLIIGNGAEDDARNAKRVQRLLATAYHYRQLLLAGDGQTIRALATSVGVTPSYFTRVVRLSFLPPEFVESILQNGQAAASIPTLEQLKSASIDLSWYRAAFY